MNFPDWLRTVDSVLRGQGKNFTTAQLDPEQLDAAWQQGLSPVVFAKSVDGPTAAPLTQAVAPQVMPALFPAPSYRMLGFLHVIFKVAAILTWIAGAILSALAIVAAFSASGAAPVAATEGARQAASGFSVMALLMAVAMAGSYFLGGCFLFLISEGIALMVSVHDRLGRVTAP